MASFRLASWLFLESVALTGVSSAAARCSRGSSRPWTACRLGVGATARPQQPTGPVRAFGYRRPRGPFLPNLPGRSSTATPSASPIMRAATLSSSRPVLAVRRIDPCRYPVLLSPPPKHRFKPISQRSADAPPRRRIRPRPAPGWATPQRQLNIHTRTRWPITDSISDATIVARPRPSAPYSSPATPSAATSPWFLLGSHGGPIAIAEPGARTLGAAAHVPDQSRKVSLGNGGSAQVVQDALFRFENASDTDPIPARASSFRGPLLYSLA